MNTPSRTVDDSRTQMTEIVLPSHANALGTVFGGTVMGWIDICGAIVAQRHCGRIAVTAAVDDLVFVAPLRVGDVTVLSGRINAAFRSSVEVNVVVEREDPQTHERTRCVEALLTFVSIESDTGAPFPAPALQLNSEDDQKREREARERRDARLARRDKRD